MKFIITNKPELVGRKPKKTLCERLIGRPASDLSLLEFVGLFALNCAGVFLIAALIYCVLMIVVILAVIILHIILPIVLSKYGVIALGLFLLFWLAMHWKL